jgi:hypothetical protein
MYHWHGDWHPGFRRYYRRGPSRFLWLALGAGTALVLIQHRQGCPGENPHYFCRRIHSFRSPQQTNNHGAGDTHGGSYVGWGPRDLQLERDKARLMDMGQQANAAVRPPFCSVIINSVTHALHCFISPRR